MRKLNLALSTAALVLSGAALAQTAPSSAPAGHVARAAKPDMTRADAQARAEAAFARMDANKDGTLNEADRAARHAAMFDRMDTDKSGSISRAEFEAMHSERGGMGRMAGHGMGAKGSGDHAMMGGMGSADHEAMMGGGMGATPTTRQAFVERALARFDRADANRDGTVTQAERKASHEAMREQMRAQGRQN